MLDSFSFWAFCVIMLRLRMFLRKRECRLMWLCSDFLKVPGSTVLSIKRRTVGLLKEAWHCDICPGEIVQAFGGWRYLSEFLETLNKLLLLFLLISCLLRPNFLSFASPDHEGPLVAQLKDSFLRESLSGHFVSVLFFLLSIFFCQIPSLVNSMSCVFLIIVQDSYSFFTS